MTKACLSLISLAFAALLLGGCGTGGSETDASAESSSRLQKVEVTLDGRAGAENAGIVMAQKLGYFRDVGIDAWVGSPAFPNRPAAYVTFGTDDLGVAQQPQMMIAQEKGMPIVPVGSVIPAHTVALMWLESSGMRRIGDLKGKTIAIPGVAFQEPFLESILARSGLSIKDVKIKKVGYGLVAALLSGKADAIFGGTLNVDRVELDERGQKLVIPAIRSLGFPPYEDLVVIARADRVAEEPQLIRRFMSAVIRGNAAVQEDPKRAAKLLYEDEANQTANLKTLEAQVQATLPLLSTSGQINPGQEAALRAWMRKEGMFR